MKKIKQWAALGLTAVLAMSLTACGGSKSSTAETAAAADETTAEADADGTTAADADGTTAYDTASGEPVTIRFSWWGGDSRHEATEKAIKAFEEKYPNIKVDPEYGAWTGWEEKQSLNILGGTAADVMQLNWNWLEAYGQGGESFANLEDYSDVIDLKQFSPEKLDLCKLNGKLMAVPVSLTGRLFFWNKSAYEEVGCEIPTDLDSLYAAGSAFEAHDPKMYPLAVGEYDRMILMVYYLESKYGKNWIEGGAMNYSEDEIKDGMDFITGLEKKHVIPTLAEFHGDMSDSIDKSPNWIDGKWAGIFEWDSAAAKNKSALEGSVNKPGQEFVLGDFVKMGDNQGGFTKIGMTLGISANSEHPKEAAMLINFLLNDEDGVKICNTVRGIPCSKEGLKIVKDNNLGDSLTIEANEKVMDYSMYSLDTKFENSDLKANPDGVYYKVFGKLSSGDYDSAKAASELTKGIKECLES